MIAAALAVGLMGAIGFATLRSASNPDPAPSAAEVADMQAGWVAATAAGIELPRIPIAQRADAIKAMSLPSADQAKLAAAVDAGQAQLVYVTVWDTYAEDNDLVELSSDGVRTMVVLRNAHTVVPLPMPQNGSVTLRGVKDGGGGGVTVGILSGGTPIRIPPMTEGQSLSIPVR